LASGRLRGVVADIMRRKALDYVVEQVNVVGLEPPASSADDAGDDDESQEQQQEQSED